MRDAKYLESAYEIKRLGVQMKKYTTILWDLDQTLLNFDRSMEHALRAVFEQYGLPIDE